MRISVIILVIILSSKAHGQILTDSLRNKFDRYQRDNLQEKIFVHLNQATYLTGETVWFKVYCIDAITHKPFTLSKVAYIDVVDKTGRNVLQNRVELSEGTGDGSFFIPASITSGNYSVFAYTNWMKNFPEEFFFRQPITIVNPFQKPDSKSSPDKTLEIDAQFFPEGGELVDGIPSRVGFRVVNKSGNGIDFTGHIINSSGDTVTHFSPGKFGLGNFLLTPVKDQIYQAVIHDRNGQSFRKNLPAIKQSGHTLRIDTRGSNLECIVRAKGDQTSTVTLFVHTRGKIIFTQSLPLVYGATAFKIPTNSLGDGISHITLFDEAGQAVCERLFYKSATENTTLQARVSNSHLKTRQNGTIEVIATSNYNNTTEGNFSVSIHQIDSLGIVNQTDVQSFLMLTSELRGRIEAPEYYLQQASAEEIDNLMLTHGWRRFDWNSISSRAKFKHLPEVQGQILTGQILNDEGVPAGDVETLLSGGLKAEHLQSYRSEADGTIRFLLQKGIGEQKLFLQPRWKKDSSYTFKIHQANLTDHSAFYIPPFILKPSQADELNERSVSMQVQNAFVKFHTIVSNAAHDSIPFYGRADEIYYLDDYTRFPVMEEVMREFVKGVWVRKRQEKFHFIVLDNVNKSVFKDDPLIILDGVPVSDVDRIMSLDPRKVKRIDVVTKEFFLGTSRFPGIVSYFTYAGDMAGLGLKKPLINYEALESGRHFFLPLYEPDQQKDRRPDQRRALAWYPSVKLTGGKVLLPFSTSDVIGLFAIEIQGITSQGSPAYTKTIINVLDR